MLNILMYIIIYFIFWLIGIFVGSFGWVQIIGSIKYAKQRGLPLTLFTVILWTLILAVLTILCFMFFKKGFYAFCAGLIIAFILSLRQKEFE